MPSSMPTGFACPRKGSPILARTGDWSKAYFATGGVTAALREAMRRSFLRTSNVPKQTQCFAPARHFLSPPVRRRSLNRLFEIHLSRKMACCLSMNGRFAPRAVGRQTFNLRTSSSKPSLPNMVSARSLSTLDIGRKTLRVLSSDRELG